MSRITNNQLSSVDPQTQDLVLRGKNVVIEGEDGTVVFTGDPIANTAPYPDKVTTISIDTDLTLDDQGIIRCVGGKPKLPAVAPDGTTYKFIGGETEVVIDSNGNTILGIGTGSDLKIGIPQLELKAVNTTPGPVLTWYPVNRRYAPSYLADRIYMIGDLVEYLGEYYVSVSDNNINNIGSPTYWKSITSTAENIIGVYTYQP